MTLFVAPLNIPEPSRFILTTTTTTEVVPSATVKQAIGKLHICNITAGAVLVDIEVHSGATVYYLEKGKSLAANTSFDLYDELLQISHSLYVKAGTVDALHVSVIYSAALR